MYYEKLRHILDERTISFFLKEKLLEIVDEGCYSDVTSDLLEYMTDLLPVMPEFYELYGIKPPFCVVKPKSIEQLTEILRLANYFLVPITLRGNGFSSHGGSIPTEGGIIIDLSGLNKILEVNKEDKYAYVEAGITWQALIDSLIKDNYEPLVYPINSLMTVGGSLSLDLSMGAGFPKYGSFQQLVRDIDILSPTAELMNTNQQIPSVGIKPNFSWLYIGTEGIFGVIVKTKIPIREVEELDVFAYLFDSSASSLSFIRKLAEKGKKPYAAFGLSSNLGEVLRESGLKIPSFDRQVFCVVFDEEIDRKDIDRIALDCKGEALDHEDSKLLWNSKFDIGNFPRLFKTRYMTSSFVVEADKASKFIGNVEKICHEHSINLLHMEIFGADGKVLFLLSTPFDEHKERIFYARMTGLHLGLFAQEAFAQDGYPLGIGLYYHHCLEKKLHDIFGYREIKEALDPNNLLNTHKFVKGKLFPPLLEFSLKALASAPRPIIGFMTNRVSISAASVALRALSAILY